MKWVVSELLFCRYEVNEMGQVRNIKTKQILKHALNKRLGRYAIVINHNGKTFSRGVNRVVASAFIPNPHNYSDVNHINGDKTDNRLVNLEWATRRMNILHDYKIGKRKRAKDLKTGIPYKGRSTSRPIVQIDLNGSEVNRFTGFVDAQNQTGVGYRNIHENCVGRRKTAGGYIWRFV